MTTVTPEDRDAMTRFLKIMEGQPTAPRTAYAASNAPAPVELAGPGQTTKADIDAMASVLRALDGISTTVVDNMITESIESPYINEALHTQRIERGVKIGRYQILEKEDAKRMAGKQFYSIYNSLTNDTIADDISLYETARAVIRLLNAGRFANSPEVRRLFEQDDTYTSHRVDALMYKRKMASTTDAAKRDIFESRYQASLDRCMAAKKLIKSILQ